MEFDLGVTPIHSITMTDCYGSITGSLVLVSSMTSVDCNPTWHYDIPAFEASITLAGDAVIDGWFYDGQIDMGSFNLRLTNITSIPFNYGKHITGTGTLTMGRPMPPSGTLVDLWAAMYIDAAEGVDLSLFSGTIELVGGAIFFAEYMPSEVVSLNIRQNSMAMFVNYSASDEVIINTVVNIYSSLSAVFTGKITAPNITLHRNTTFLYADLGIGTSVVDLTGINLNGFCDLKFGLIGFNENLGLSIADWANGSVHFTGVDIAECVENPGGGDGNGNNGNGSGTTEPDGEGGGTPSVPGTGFFSRLSGGAASSAVISAVAGAGIALGLYLRRKSSIN